MRDVYKDQKSPSVAFPPHFERAIANMSSTAADLRQAVEAFRPSAGGPIPTDPWTAQYWDMASAHVTFLNALLGIYEVRGCIYRR